MDKRPDEVGRGDALRERGTDPLTRGAAFDPATDAFQPDAVADVTGREASEVDEVAVTQVEIERTRADMSETVDAIQNRLSPENLKEQAKDRVKEATVGKAQGAGSMIANTIRENPVPAALTGIGLGWLIMNGRKRSQARVGYEGRAVRAYPPVDAYPPVYGEGDGDDTSAAGQTLGRARDKVGETAAQAQDTAGQVASQAQDQVARAGDRARYQARRARYQARRAGDGFQRVLQDSPLAVGVLAAGVGAAVGLAIPETTKENEVMGEARDTLVEKAQEKAQDAQQRVQQVAQEAQTRAARGKDLARIWMHNGMIELRDKWSESPDDKMSKSLGNIVGLSDALDSVGRDTLIMYFVSGHYRQPVAYGEGELTQAAARVERFRDAGRALVAGPSPEDLAAHRDAFFDALAEDFNTAQALRHAHDWINEANRRKDVGDSHLREMLEVFGLENLLDADEAPEELMELARRREQARSERDFATADKLRDEIRAEGWEVRDGPQGPELVPAS